jgi:hypothetical protein
MAPPALVQPQNVPNIPVHFVPVQTQTVLASLHPQNVLYQEQLQINTETYVNSALAIPQQLTPPVTQNSNTTFFRSPYMSEGASEQVQKFGLGWEDSISEIDESGFSNFTEEHNWY